VISSMLGTFTVPIWEKFPVKFLRAHDAEESMFRSYEVSSIFTVTLSIFLAYFYAHDWRLAALTAVGVGLAVAFNPFNFIFYVHKKSTCQRDRQVH
jgi:K(+)-stimulated pyrophosphate-energized sodium pump